MERSSSHRRPHPGHPAEPSGPSRSKILALAAVLLLALAAGAGCKKDKPKKSDDDEASKASAAVEITPELRESAKSGKKVFASKCASCHSIGGGDMVGPDLKDVHSRRDEAWLKKWVKNPTPMLESDPTAKKLLKKFNNVPMPALGLSDDEVHDVLAHIAVASAAGEAPAKIDLEKRADNIKGRKVVDFVSSECGGCHNPKRLGATGPNITMKRLREGLKDLAPLNEEAIYATIKNGRPGTSMPAWGTDNNPIGSALSDEEVSALAYYIYNNEAPKDFSWTLQQMKDTHEVLIPKSELPDKPTHGARMDDLLLVTERENFSVGVVDGDKLEVVGHMEAGARAHGYTFHPNGRFAYNLGRDGWLYKYDLYQLKPTRKVRLGMDARGIAISDDGKYLLLGMYIPTQAVIVDADTLEPLKVYSTKNVDSIEGGKVDSRICTVNDVSPKKVGPYFVMALKEAGQVWRINYSKPGFPVEKVTNVGKILHDGFLSQDNKYLFLASQNSNHMAVIDIAKMEIVAKLKTGKKPHPGPGATWEADGKRYAGTPHIGDKKAVIWTEEPPFEIAGEVPATAPGLFIRTTPHMKYVWFDSIYDPKPNEITVFEKKPPFKVVKRINDGTLTLHPEPDADGDYVFISDWKEGVVRVYDDESLELVKTIDGLKTPTGIFSISRIEETEGH